LLLKDAAITTYAINEKKRERERCAAVNNFFNIYCKYFVLHQIILRIKKL